jgi:hypothetical protein
MHGTATPLALQARRFTVINLRMVRMIGRSHAPGAPGSDPDRRGQSAT